MKHFCSLDLTGSVTPLTRRSFVAGAAALPICAAASPLLEVEGNAVDNSIFELRQYTLYGGQRDALISLFEKNFIEPQETVGAHVIGTFRDIDDPDRFVWIRGFRDMPARQQALQDFYGSSPAWITHKKEANATMVDSDNVLLLRTLSSQKAFSGNATNGSGSNAVFGVTIYFLGGVDSAQFGNFFDHSVVPHLNTLGAYPIATLATIDVPNNFPRLPIREHDRVFLWIGRWPSAAGHEAFCAQMRVWSGWRDSTPETLLPALMRKPEQLRLKPTTRSILK